MPTPAQISSKFADVKAILDQALSSGGGIFTALTPGQAVQFRQRAYTFRKAFREACKTEVSPYDRITLRKLEPGETAVRIDFIVQKGTFTPNEPSAPTPDPSDDLFLGEALALRERLGLDG